MTLWTCFKTTASRSPGNLGSTWETATEENNKGFNIERLVGSGNWETVGYKASKATNGNSSSRLNYQHSDFNPEKGISQYRLRQVDIGGRTSYSNIRSVRGIGQNDKTIVYPNPSYDGRVNVVFEEVNSIRNITLSDMSGRNIKQWKSVSNNNIQIENLAPGFYTMRIVNTETGEQDVQKIVVNKR